MHTSRHGVVVVRVALPMLLPLLMMMMMKQKSRMLKATVKMATLLMLVWLKVR